MGHHKSFLSAGLCAFIALPSNFIEAISTLLNILNLLDYFCFVPLLELQV
jgi:hypothetical protein